MKNKIIALFIALAICGALMAGCNTAADTSRSGILSAVNDENNITVDESNEISLSITESETQNPDAAEDNTSDIAVIESDNEIPVITEDNIGTTSNPAPTEGSSTNTDTPVPTQDDANSANTQTQTESNVNSNSANHTAPTENNETVVISPAPTTESNTSDAESANNNSISAANIIPLSSTSADENTIITLTGATAIITGGGATVSGGTVTINQAGTYIVSGTLSKGQIYINAPKDERVVLVLNGVDITADQNAAIYAASADRFTITLADGTVNTLTDNETYVYATANEEPDAALFAKCDLRIDGTGTLIVNANYKNGIRTKDDLVISNGNFIINAVNNGLHGKDSVKITGGNFDIISGNDGIKSSSDEKKGWVEISGGEFSIKSASDGIQAETDLLISGGRFNIITGGGSDNAPVRSGGMGGMPGGRGGFGFSPQQTAVADTESMKGLKAVNLVNISGGTFIIDTEDDGINSDNDILISGGSFEIKTGDDGIHADYNVLITGGEINIIQSYEGIEGLTVTVEGGDVSITASDDGINASQGEGKALNGGRPTSGVNQEAYIRITGGTVDIHSGTDGLDSNGHIYIEGGLLTVSAPSQTMEGAIDKDGDLIITGGSIITAGSWDAAPRETAQPVILMSYTQQLSVGTHFAIKNSKSNILLEYISKTAFSMSGFTSPDFEIGETYTLYINGEKRIDITLNNITTSLSDNGGAYNASRGGLGGGNRGRQQPNMPRG